MKSNLRSRSIKLLGLAAKVGGREITQNVKDKFARGVEEIASGRLKTRIDQAKLIAEHLSQLKGAAMKAGQLLSLDGADLFPPEAVEILSKLQGKADPVDWSIVRGVLEEDLGEDKIAQFKGLTIVPEASASIGQVHRARVGDQEVAIKIQYPGIADSIDSDLKILKTLAQSLVTVTGRRVQLDETFDELRLVLHQEANYELELRHMQEYRALLDGDPNFVVPVPLPEFSSKRVLTMSWERGITLQDWLKTKPSLEARNTIGRRLLDLYCREFFEWGLVQTDPNYGNFLIRPDNLELIVLDFGATLRYTADFRREYVKLLKVVNSRDPEAIVQASIDFGLMSDKEGPESRKLLADMMILSIEPFAKDATAFDFKDADYSRRTREATQAFAQSLKFSPPPRKIIFLHRKLGGIFAFLKRLEAEIDVSAYWSKMVDAQVKD